MFFVRHKKMAAQHKKLNWLNRFLLVWESTLVMDCFATLAMTKRAKSFK